MTKEEKRAYNLAWYHTNKKPKKPKTPEQRCKQNEYQKQWVENNKEGWNQYMKQYNIDNKERKKERENGYYHKRKQVDSLWVLKQNTSSLIRWGFKNKNIKKNTKSIDILGCTWEQFKQHIESQFEPWMTWDNRGSHKVLGPNITWDLDHIIPVSSAVNEEDIKRLNHYTNFQPLCSYQNRFVKRDKKECE